MTRQFVGAAFLALVLFNAKTAKGQSSDAQNLETCLSGKYPILCKHALLTPEQQRAMFEAERRENLILCSSGQYRILCHHEWLSAEEQKSVALAERTANRSICLDGRYVALCQHSLLAPADTAQVHKAELSARQIADSAPLSESRIRARAVRRTSRSGCETGHWVESVSSDGSIVKLEDGSIWEVDEVDRIDSQLWLTTTSIIACSDRLINTDDNEVVSAERIK